MGFWSISPQPQGVSDEGLIFETSEDVEVLPTFDALLGVEPVGWLVGWWWTRELLTCQGWWWCYELSHRIILAVFNQLVRLGFSCWSWKMEWRWCIMVDVCRCYQQILLWDERYIVCHHHDCSHFVIKQGSNGDHSLLLPSWSVCNCWTWYPAVARASS